ncbi:MAG: hypothetical protein ABF750_08100 [Oenococcus oeni]
MTIKDIKKPENVRSGQTYNINGLRKQLDKNSLTRINYIEKTIQVLANNQQQKGLQYD